MVKIERKIYQIAFESIIEEIGYQYKRLKLGNILLYKDGRRVCINISGRNLPYYRTNGQETFPWETYIKQDKLDRIEHEARNYNAEGWMAYCYAILSDNYLSYFNHIVNINKISSVA